ncbi:hypothetical protein COU88_02085 [Candidatus Roizmanbacteria bacterium CG10_big_fil_rev_8_21_14_0_10_39_6]|uniref:Glycosyltransferase RgtA/B/C/D-like domain-containing protein n=1 Tax=Candidatus Roizmanbacteria bacterium CG10_big_fil_rev_8_21_14_0_10_39_6 TaxID=1974853 RepID=A0A2M8KSU2_9BACT|nr:MAG: hypothetical protein COU88_02085 [Candidatus Roizmanbacteria bacterium CG10_big_fil_rev_8_21_14_0_10_39_6]
MIEWLRVAGYFILFQYLIGHIFLSFLWKNRTSNILMHIPLAWIIGNALSIPLLYILAFYNKLDIINPITGTIIFVLALVVAGTASTYNKKGVRVSVRQLLLLGAIIIFFLPLIRDSLYSFLIEWDAVAMWFIKAKAFFVAPGMWDNVLYQSKAFLYTERSYPIGGPLLIATYYRLIGFANDQTVQVYFLFFYLNSVVLALGFLYERIKSLSLLSILFIVLSFFITPLFIRFSHNGYMDMAMANSIASVVVLAIYQYEDKASHTRLYLIPMLLIAGSGALIKNEGLPFLVLTVIVGWGISLYKKKAALAITTSSIVLIYPLIAKLLWEYYKRNAQIHFYLTTLLPGADIRARISLIVGQYLDTLQYTSTQSVVVILSFFLLLFLTTALVYKKQYSALLPQVFIVGQLGAYTYMYLITALPLNIQLPSSFDRLVLRLLPALFIVLVYQGEKVIKIFSNKQLL